MTVPLALLHFLSFLLSVTAFNFTSTTLSECDDFTVEWAGGTGPFQLTAIPSFGTPKTAIIPDSAYRNGRGSFSMQATFPRGQAVALTMSDATGFAAGGTSRLFTVEATNGGTCDSSDPGTDFAFQLNYALLQCRPFIFEGWSGAVHPITIQVVVPGGTAIELHPPPGAESFSWMVNVATGTPLMFIVFDAEGNQGGASEVKNVGASDERGCLEGQVLSTTAPALSPATSSTPAPAPTPTSIKDSPGEVKTQEDKPVSIGAIAGTVIGSLLFLAVIITLGLFILKNIKKKRDEARDMKRNYPSSPYAKDDLAHGSSHPYGPAGPPFYNSPPTVPRAENPFRDSSYEVYRQHGADSTLDLRTTASQADPASTQLMRSNSSLSPLDTGSPWPQTASSLASPRDPSSSYSSPRPYTLENDHPPRSQSGSSRQQGSTGMPRRAPSKASRFAVVNSTPPRTPAELPNVGFS